MSDEMGILRTDVEIENPARPGPRGRLLAVLVDTGAELSWAPSSLLESLGIERRASTQFQMANGTVITRSLGVAMLYAGGKAAPDWIVFGEPSGQLILGARTLEGLNLRVDLVSRRLVSGGPIEAAAAA